MNKVEGIDLNDPSKTCEPISDYPYDDGDMTVGLVDGLVKSCGGILNTRNCYDYIPSSGTWVDSTNMLTRRKQPKSSSIDGIWLLSGDTLGYGTIDMEMWTVNGFEAGLPPFPVDSWCLQCQVTLNSTHIFFTFGYQSFPDSFLLDWYAQTWTQLPQMPMNMSESSCGLINNPTNGAEIVIVEEGESQIFNAHNLTWRTGPEVYEKFDYAGSAPLGDTFVMVGGSDKYSHDELDTIYQFDHINYNWILKPQKLQLPRSLPGVVAVPDDFVTCV